ncbi:HlyD family efflux transporter periplasmic adaptor subunit [Rhizobium sp. BK251]|uniref:HlyD family secretion protein n=1 Tax=Rhizobium sp. BK251 TaxID=2512125 RepID=UPI00104B70B5|nr:HlyD family efflux transporter periplasmic adaptor subunit [Rhizobium sp. BK251]TCL69684.1 HlyD family secretion protein [Rhizobium sp. BK251]
MRKRQLGIVVSAAFFLCAAGLAFAEDGAATFSSSFEALWGRITGQRTPPNVTMSNGRIEAQQMLISAKFAGRLAEFFFEEGRIVEAGAPIARIDTAELDEQLVGASAQVRRSQAGQIGAQAALARRDGELALARLDFDRVRLTTEKGTGTAQQLELCRVQVEVAATARRAALASRDAAQAATDAARAEVARVQSLLDDAVLRAPRRGRVEYSLAQPGQFLAVGAPVATLLDLSDVSMTIFLPARAAEQLSIGDEARIILDPLPQYVVPATVSFVSGEAQFTPKAVETQVERDSLVFEVRLKIASDLLKSYETWIKVGVKGLGYVRTDPSIDWPIGLRAKLPP